MLRVLLLVSLALAVHAAYDDRPAAKVKKFIFEDFEKRYEPGVTHFKKMPGKAPVMFFLDAEDHIIEQVEISDKKRQELRDLMAERGFAMKEEEKKEGGHDEV